MSKITAYLGTPDLTDVGYRFYDLGTPTGPRVTAGIIDTGEGWYEAEATLAGNVVRWDSTGTADAIAREDISLRRLVEALSIETGSGAFEITVTVTDGTDPLENARVRISDGVTPITQLTDANGQATFGLDAATYDVSITKAGYSFTPTTRTVTGDQAGTLTDDLEMSLVIRPEPPAIPDTCVIFGYLTKIATMTPAVGVVVTATRKPEGIASAGAVLIGKSITARTDADGYFELAVPKSETISPAGSQWLIQCNEAGIKTQAAFNTDTFDIATIVPD